MVAPAPVVYQGPAQTSGKAIASLVFGFLFFLLPAAIVAIVLGHISLSEIKKSAGRLEGQGLAIGGLILGYLGIAAIPLILIIAAIAIPNILRARMAANESSAASGIRTLNTAEVTYASEHADAGYTCSLSDLRELIGDGLASGAKNGYTFKLQDCTPETVGGPNAKYRVVAYPMTPNQTGVRAFCSDESAVIRVDGNGSAEACLEHGKPLQ